MTGNAFSLCVYLLLHLLSSPLLSLLPCSVWCSSRRRPWAPRQRPMFQHRRACFGPQSVPFLIFGGREQLHQKPPSQCPSSHSWLRFVQQRILPWGRTGAEGEIATRSYTCELGCVMKEVLRPHRSGCQFSPRLSLTGVLIQAKGLVGHEVVTRGFILSTLQISFWDHISWSSAEARVPIVDFHCNNIYSWWIVLQQPSSFNPYFSFCMMFAPAIYQDSHIIRRESLSCAKQG